MPTTPPGSPGNPSTSIPLTGTGGLFSRIGKLGAVIDEINAHRGTVVPESVDEIHDQYLSTNQDVIEDIYSKLLSFQNSSSGFISSLKTIASDTVIEMANDALLLADRQLGTALNHLLAQMEAQGETVKACTVSASSATAPANVGNPVVVLSTRTPDGLVAEYAFNELVTAVAGRDSQQTPAAAGVESLSGQGQASISDTFSWLFPQGSGSRFAVQATSGKVSPPNWLANGSFESFPTADTPGSWKIVAGTPGTTVFQSTATAYDGSALRVLGNGSENTSLRERFSSPAVAGDMAAGMIAPRAQLAVNLFLRVSATPAAGVLRVALTDGTAVVADQEGAPNQFTINLTGVSTSWVAANGVFRTPDILPAAAYLEIKLTTPLSAGVSLYIDRCSLIPMTIMYPGGPSIAIFSGNVNMMKGDTIWVSVYNNYGGGFQQLFNKLFGMASRGMILPSSASPTIPDSLIS